MLAPPLPPEFGLAVHLLGSLNLPIDPMTLNGLRNAARAGTLTILRSDGGDPVGFVCWAGGNKDSVKIAERFNLFPHNVWEFKEGRIAMLLLVHFARPFNVEARQAFMRFVRGRRAIYYTRKNRKRLALRTSAGHRLAEVGG
jgi:hypothetical protein